MQFLWPQPNSASFRIPEAQYTITQQPGGDVQSKGSDAARSLPLALMSVTDSWLEKSSKRTQTGIVTMNLDVALDDVACSHLANREYSSDSHPVRGAHVGALHRPPLAARLHVLAQHCLRSAQDSCAPADHCAGAGSGALGRHASGAELGQGEDVSRRCCWLQLETLRCLQGYRKQHSMGGARDYGGRHAD